VNVKIHRRREARVAKDRLHEFWLDAERDRSPHPHSPARLTRERRVSPGEFARGVLRGGET
jgi:hypothetical protein